MHSSLQLVLLGTRAKAENHTVARILHRGSLSAGWGQVLPRVTLVEDRAVSAQPRCARDKDLRLAFCIETRLGLPLKQFLDSSYVKLK